MSGADASSRRRRRWPIVLLVVVVVLTLLVVTGGFLAERAARDQVSGVASTALAERLGVPADAVEVQVGPGPLLPQLLSGRVDRVEVTASKLTVQGVTASFDATLRGVAVDGTDARSVAGTVTIPGSELTALAAQSGDAKIESIRTDAPSLIARATASAFGLTVPVAVTLRPSADGGAVVLTPTSVQVAGGTVEADSLRSGPLSGVAAKYLQPTRVCVADSLPSGLALRSARVSGGELVLGLTGSDVVLRGAGTGSCG